MSGPYLVPCLVTLRAEFNALNPRRDKGSDGWIGDAAHQGHTSDHNPQADGRVLAIDIDSTGPWPVPFGTLVESLRGDSRLEYIIWNRRIASRSQGWTWRTYTGTSDPHTGHAHFSARHDHTGNTSIKEWGVRTMATIDELRDAVEYNRKVLGNIQTAINNLPDDTTRRVLDAIAAPASSPDEIAALLRPVLGDRAAAVGRALAGDAA